MQTHSRITTLQNYSDTRKGMSTTFLCAVFAFLVPIIHLLCFPSRSPFTFPVAPNRTLSCSRSHLRSLTHAFSDSRSHPSTPTRARPFTLSHTSTLAYPAL